MLPRINCASLFSQVNSHPLLPMTPLNGRSHAAAAGQSLMELAAKDEFGFLVPYYMPDFYCGELRAGLAALERELELEGGYDSGGRERGSPDDELLLVGRRAGGQAGRQAGQVG